MSKTTDIEVECSSSNYENIKKALEDLKTEFNRGIKHEKINIDKKMLKSMVNLYSKYILYILINFKQDRDIKQLNSENENVDIQTTDSSVSITGLKDPVSQVISRIQLLKEKQKSSQERRKREEIIAVRILILFTNNKKFNHLILIFIYL